MKGLVKTAVLLCAAAAGSVGCYGYRDLVDPCYPERWEYMSRQEVRAALTPQVQNGHVLDQTVWDYHFEKGTDKLTDGGLDHLAYLARRRPAPDPLIYLQTAQGVPYDPANPEKLAEARNDLDGKRIVAIQKFLNADTAGRPVAFQVQVHDPALIDLAAAADVGVVQQMYGSFRGSLSRGGASVTGGAGAVPGGR